MSLNKRYIDINFDADARPLKRVPGTIVQGNNKVNILRITYPNVSSDHVVIALSKRADQITGSTFLNYSSGNNCFELILHNWFTAISGELQITFAVYSQTPEVNDEGIITTEADMLRKVYLNVEESISADLPAPEDESIFLDVAVMVKSYDTRIQLVEELKIKTITDLTELDDYTIPGIYKFNLNNKKVFNLFVYTFASGTVINQIRSSNDGYHERTFTQGTTPTQWNYYQYTVNGVSYWNNTINYILGAIVYYNSSWWICSLETNKGIVPSVDTPHWYRLDLKNYVARNDLGELAFKNSLSKEDIGLGDVLNVPSYSKTETDSLINNVVEVAEGKTQTFVISTSSSVNSILNSQDNVITIESSSFPLLSVDGDSINIADLKVGDIIYITDINVPDRWVGVVTSTFVGLYKLETSKVDLSGLATEAELEELKIKTITDLTELDDYTTKGIYQIIYGTGTFHLFVDVSNMGYDVITQYRTSANGYYTRTYWGNTNTWSEWEKHYYNVDGVSYWYGDKTYIKGAIVYYNGANYLSLVDDNNATIPGTSEGKWKLLNFQNFIENKSEDSNNISIVSKGNVTLSADNDILLNNISWTETYKKVQSIYGTYVDSYITTDISIPKNALDYALVNKIYGLSLVVGNKFKHSSIQELNVPRTANIFNSNIKDYTTGTYTRIELIDNGIRVFCDMSTTEEGKVYTSAYLDIPVECFEKGKTYRFMCNIKSNSTNTSRIRLMNILSDGTQTGIYDTNSLGNISDYFSPGNVFTINENAVFIRVNFYSNNGGISTKGDYIDYTNIFFGISDADEYIPYLDFNWKVPESITLLEGYGLGITQDISNVVDFDARTYTINVGKLSLNECTWSKSSNTNVDRYIGTFPSDSKYAISYKVFLINNSRFKSVNYLKEVANEVCLNAENQIVINFAEAGTTTLEDFLAWLEENPTEIVYQLLNQEIIDIGNIDNLIEVVSDSRVVNNSDNAGRGIIEMEYQIKVGY